MNPGKKLLIVFSVLPVFLYAQVNTKNDNYHPLIPEFPGASVVYYKQVEDTSYVFTFGPLVKHSPDEEYKLTDTEVIKGDLTRIQYKLEESDLLKVVNYFEHSLKMTGFEIAAVTKGSKPMEAAGRNWTFFVFRDLPQKEKSNIAGTKKGSGNRYFIAGHLHRLNRKAYFSMIINELDYGEIYVHTDIILSDYYPLKREILSAAQIEQAINADGRAVVNGIYFDINSADIREESKPALAEIAEYLKRNMGVNLYVVGHTGMTGKFDYLISLSKNMADAVIKYLAARHNINPERLTPEGVGPLSPLTSNQSLDGRYLNTRVELVLKNF